MSDYIDTIQALRTGVVPSKDIKSICTGRKAEEEEFEKILVHVKNGNTYTKFISGSYGQGKSFFLTYIRELAYNYNFVVSKISLNDSVQLNKIEVVYRNIIKELYCKSGKGIKHILDNWITKIKIEAETNYDNKQKQLNFIKTNLDNDLKKVRVISGKYANAIKKYYESEYIYHNQEMSNAAIEWLSGEDIKLEYRRKLDVEKINKNNTLEYLKALSTLIKSIKYWGLVILFDEIESIEDLRKNSRNKAFDYIRGFIDSSGDNEYESTLFVFALTPEFFADENKGIASSKALFSRLDTSDSGDYTSIKNPLIYLPSFNKKDLIDLTQIIQYIHNKAYEWDSNEFIGEVFDEIIDYNYEDFEINSINLRDYTKYVVDKLDYMRENKDEFKDTEKVLELFKGINDDIEW